MRTSILQQPMALRVATWIVVLLAIGPLFFPLEWLFHIFSDKHPVIHRMRELGATPKALWVLCGPLAVTTIFLLNRHPLLGFAACALLAALYIPIAIVLWGQFSLGCWAAIAAVIFAGIGAVVSWRA
jgi:hypothetical protein